MFWTRQTEDKPRAISLPAILCFCECCALQRTRSNVFVKETKLQSHQKNLHHSFCFSQTTVYFRHGCGIYFSNKDLLTSFIKFQVSQVFETPRFNDANDKPLHIICSRKSYVNVGRLTELLTFILIERLAVLVTLGCHFFDQLAEVIYQKTSSVILVDGSIDIVIRHYWEQWSANTTVSKYVKPSYGTERFAPEIWSTQLVHILSLVKPTYVSNIRYQF